MVRIINFLRLMQLLSRAVRLFMPWVRGLIGNTLGLILVTVLTFWRGVPAKVDDIANDWLDRADSKGFPTEYDRHLYWVLYVLAFGVIVLGWVGMSFLTVWILGVLF